MHTAQPKNSFINRYYRKRSISPRKYNANYIHGRPPAKWKHCQKSAKFVKTCPRRIKSDLCKMLASMNSIITSLHNALPCDGSCWTVIKIVIKRTYRECIIDQFSRSYFIGEKHTVLSNLKLDYLSLIAHNEPGIKSLILSPLQHVQLHRSL